MNLAKDGLKIYRVDQKKVAVDHKKVALGSKKGSCI